MPTHSEGEHFSSSDVDFTADTDNESVAQIQDNWIFPVVSSKASREEYQNASKFPKFY